MALTPVSEESDEESEGSLEDMSPEKAEELGSLAFTAGPESDSDSESIPKTGVKQQEGPTKGPPKDASGSGGDPNFTVLP